MKSKLTKIFIYLILSLLIVVSVFFMLSSKDKISYSTNQFAVKNIDSITKIQIKGSDKILTLNKNDGSWTINKYKLANQKKIEEFLFFLTKIKVDKPLSKYHAKKTVEQFKKSINVCLFKKSEIEKSFFIKRIENKVYIMSDKNHNPFEISLMEWDIDFVKYFSANENIWSEKSLIKANIKQLESIKLICKDDAKSFVLTEEKGCFYLKNKYLNKSINYNLVNDFLKKASSIKFAKYEDKISWQMKDSIINSTPIFTFKIKKNKKTYTIKGFDKKIKSTHNVLRSDPNFLYILIDNQHLVSAKYYDLFPITNALRIYFE